MVLVLLLLHAFGMGIGTSRSTLGASRIVQVYGRVWPYPRLALAFILQWDASASNGVNPAAGLIAGCFMFVIILVAIFPIRRWAFNLFWLTHWLWPLAYIFAVLHTLYSDTNVWLSLRLIVLVL
jgi:hypothetical protein